MLWVHIWLTEQHKLSSDTRTGCKLQQHPGPLLSHPFYPRPPQRYCIYLGAAFADDEEEFGGAGAPQIFLTNCGGMLWIVKGCRTPQPLPTPTGGSTRAFDSSISNWDEQGSEAVTAPQGPAVPPPVCSCFYSLWNKLPSQVHITHPKFFSGLKEKLNCQVL